MTATVSAGADPGYLLNAVGKGAENYYLKAIGEAGEPPGVWSGDAAKDLGLSGEINPDVMRDLYTHLTDPRQQDRVNESLSAIEHEKGSPEWKAAAEQIRASARLGSKLRDYSKSNEKRVEEALAKLPEDATPEQRRAAEMAVRRDSKAARPYYDVTYSAPKSWSLYHASLQIRAGEARQAGDSATADQWERMAGQVWDAWMEGVQAGNDYLQEHAGFAREGRWQGKDADGKSTGRRVDAHEFVIASFRQHTNRDDEPQMHVHNAILNRVPVVSTDPVTGEKSTKWLSLDGQLIYAHAKAAGHVAERVAEEALTRRLGVRFATRPDGVAREILGISQDLRDEHSGRRRQVTQATAELARAYEERYGHAPSAHLLAKMSQQATLESRQPKRHEAPSREQLLARWEEKTTANLRESLRDVPEAVAAAAEHHGQDAMPFDPERVIRNAIEQVELARPEWQRKDLLVEVSRQIPDCLGGLEPHQTRALVDELTDRALSPESDYGVVQLTPPELIDMPDELRLENGESVYAKPGGVRYSTGRHLDAEDRLAKAPTQMGAPRISEETIERVITERGLTGAQADAVRGIATSGRLADMLAAPAGAGKTYSMSALASAWETDGGRVIGLATSQNAADVLKHDGVSSTANLAKFLTEHSKDGGPAPEFQLEPGQLVIVDEASMVDTRTLDRVRTLAEQHGAKLLLTGDAAQLSAVGAGGAFAQLTEQHQDIVHTLDEVRRFSAEWEREASLRLREGDFSAVADYEARGRIRSGTREEMTRLAYQDWLADTMAGQESALTVETNEDAAELAARCRSDLIRLGVVTDESGAQLHNGTAAGRGDRIALRKIDRSLTSVSGRRVATNRDTARVTGIADDGSLTVQFSDGDLMHLPAEYVSEHVELAYASTVHAVQGATVSTGGIVVDEGTSRNALYVGLTRGREENRLYVVTEQDGAPSNLPPDQRPDHLSVLDGVLSNDATTRSARTVQRQELEYEGSLTKWGGIWRDINFQIAEVRYGRVLKEVYGKDGYRQLRNDEAYSSLMRLTRYAKDQGRDPEALLRTITAGRSLADADSGASVLHWRLERELERLEKTEAQQAEATVQTAVTEHEDRLTDIMGDGPEWPELEPAGTVTEDAATEAQALAAQFQTAPTLGWNGDMADARAATNAAIQAQSADPQAVQADTAPQRDAEPAVADEELAGAYYVHYNDGYYQGEEHEFELLMQRQAELAGQLDTLHSPEHRVREEISQAAQAAAEERADWRHRAADLPDDGMGRVAREIAEFREMRRDDLGRQLLDDRQRGQAPGWVQSLGPVPDTDRGREEWVQRAGTIAAYREAHGHTADDAIGPRPPRGSVDARTDWESAARALRAPAERGEVLAASDAELRETVRQYEREALWAPPHVADQLQDTHHSIQDWRREAVQTRIAAAEADSPEARAELEAEAAGYEELAAQQLEAAEKLEQVHAAREAWHSETEQVRTRAQEAREMLSLREPESESATAVEEDQAVPAVEERDGQALAGQELDDAVATAGRAQEILAERAAERDAAPQPDAAEPPAPAVEAPQPEIDTPSVG